MNKIEVIEAVLDFLKNDSIVDFNMAIEAMAAYEEEVVLSGKAWKFIEEKYGPIVKEPPYNFLLKSQLVRFGDILDLFGEDKIGALIGREEDIRAAEYLLREVFKFRDSAWELVEKAYDTVHRSKPSKKLKSMFMFEYFIQVKLKLKKLNEGKEAILKNNNVEPVDMRGKIYEWLYNGGSNKKE